MRRCVNLILLFLSAVFLVSAQESEQSCPKIEVNGPAGITQRGEEMSFTANVVGADSDIRYDWTVSTGRIVLGQGTAAVIVIADEPDSVVTATVKISGFSEGCESTASESGGVAPVPPSCPLDEWEVLRPNDERGRLDAFFAEIANNPASKGIFIFIGVPVQKRAINHPKIKFIVGHARFRKFDTGRLIFAFDKEGPSQWEDEFLIRTVLFRVPPGADLPDGDIVVFDGTLLKPRKPAAATLLKNKKAS